MEDFIKKKKKKPTGFFEDLIESLRILAEVPSDPDGVFSQILMEDSIGI